MAEAGGGGGGAPRRVISLTKHFTPRAPWATDATRAAPVLNPWEGITDDVTKAWT